MRGLSLLRYALSARDPVSIEHALRTTLAVMSAFGLAKLLSLAQPHWAPISAMVVTQSSLAASIPISVQRLVGTALGAVVGTVGSFVAHENSWVYAVAVLALGILCSVTRMDRAAYRYAGITCTIVLLIHYQSQPWVTAYERFVEVSLGIVIGLIATALPLRVRAAS